MKKTLLVSAILLMAACALEEDYSKRDAAPVAAASTPKRDAEVVQSTSAISATTQTAEPYQVLRHLPGTAIKLAGDVAVYLVRSDATLDKFASATALHTSGYADSMVVTVTAAEFSCYEVSGKQIKSGLPSPGKGRLRDGTLIKENDRSTVYVVSDGIAWSIVSYEIYTASGYKDASVEIIAAGTLITMVDGVGNCGMGIACLDQEYVSSCAAEEIGDIVIDDPEPTETETATAVWTQTQTSTPSQTQTQTQTTVQTSLPTATQTQTQTQPTTVVVVQTPPDAECMNAAGPAACWIYPNVGICRDATKTCVNGKYTDCSGGQGPLLEICGNGIDEDCDGADLPCAVPPISVSTATKTQTVTSVTVTAAATDTATQTTSSVSVTAAVTNTATQTQTQTQIQTQPTVSAETWVWKGDGPSICLNAGYFMPRSATRAVLRTWTGPYITGTNAGPVAGKDGQNRFCWDFTGMQAGVYRLWADVPDPLCAESDFCGDDGLAGDGAQYGSAPNATVEERKWLYCESSGCDGHAAWSGTGWVAANP